MNDLISAPFRSILYRLPYAIFVKNASGQYLDANQSFLNIVGLKTVAQLIDRTEADLPCSAQLKKLLCEADDQIYSKQKDHVSYQQTLLLANHQKFHIQLDKYGCPQENEAVGIFGIFSQLKAVQQPEQLYLENIIERIPYYIFWKDQASVYLGCNQRFATFVGKKSPKQVIGKTDYELNWGMGEPELFQQGDDDAMHGKPKVNVEEILIRPDQTKIVMLVSKVPLRDKQDNCIGVLGISTDITSRKQMEESLKIAKEEAELSNRVKAEFISNMSHDVRTPLTGIVGTIALMEKDPDLTPVLRQSTQKLLRASEQLLLLLNNVLEVISTNHLDENNVEKKSFDLLALIQGLYDLLLPSAEKKGLAFEKTIDQSVPAWIQSDRFKLERILLNLLSNSIKFTKSGSVSLQVKTVKNLEQAEKSNETILQFVIKDTGIGIEAALLPKIFDQFFRATGTYKGIYEGHGIGLYITKKFVGLLGGQITVASETQRGSTFCLELPVLLASPPESANTQTPIASQIVPSALDLNPTVTIHEKPTLLLVEDNEIAAYVAKTLLESIGFAVNLVGDGESALRAAKQSIFNLIVTDIGLPGISGNEWVAAYRHWEWVSGRESIAIIGLTAHADKQIQADCLAAGINEMLTKPLNTEKAKAFYLQVIAEKTKNSTLTQTDAGKELELPGTEAKLFELASYPLFDEALSLKTLGTQEALRFMIRLLIERDLPNELASLEQAHQISDWQQIQEIAHKLKGSAIYCGTPKMLQACQHLQRYLLAGQIAQREALFQQLIDVIQTTKSYFVDWFKPGG